MSFWQSSQHTIIFFPLERANSAPCPGLIFSPDTGQILASLPFPYFATSSPLGWAPDISLDFFAGVLGFSSAFFSFTISIPHWGHLPGLSLVIWHMGQT